MIDNFISEVKTRGLARTNRYLVRIPMPFADATDNRLTEILCDSVQLPGTTMATTPSKVWGEVREMPYERTYDNITLSFYLDTQLQTKKLFDQWMALIQDPVTRTLNYYDNYVTQIDIDVLSLEDDSPMYSLKLFEAYPKTINAIQLDASDRNIMKLQVVMNYKYYTTSAQDEQAREDELYKLDQTVLQDPQGVTKGEGFSTAVKPPVFKPPVTRKPVIDPYNGQWFLSQKGQGGKFSGGGGGFGGGGANGSF